MKQFLLIAALLLPSTLMAQTSNDAQAQIEALTAKVTALEKKLSDTRNQLATALQRQEDIGRIDDMIFQQCMLYTLERRYNRQRIQTARECFDRLALWNNATYREACKDKLEMMDHYEEYNQDLLDFMRRMQTELETAAKPWEKDALTEMAFNNGLQALKYMPVFKQRNSHPYRCIPYLDDAIEQLQLMMKGYGPVQKEAFLSLLASLTPKQ